jgi:DNA-binding IclR family transcriptional regulator
MDVKLVARTLDLFELFAAEQRPLPLTELARLLNVPVSSCLALARTLVSRGYLVEVRKRGGYYPTRRLQMLASAINAVDPVVEIVHPRLVQLRDASGETAVLGKIQGMAVVYLDVVESTKAIRYSRAPGELRPLHANSIGKAIFGELDAAAQQVLGALPPRRWPICPRSSRRQRRPRRKAGAPISARVRRSCRRSRWR